MASSSGLAPSWLDASLGGPVRPKQSDRPPPGPSGAGASMGRSMGAGYGPGSVASFGGSGSREPTDPAPVRTGPYRPPMIAAQQQHAPTGRTAVSGDRKSSRDPSALPKRNAFDSQFPTLGASAQGRPQNGGAQSSDATRSAAAWGASRTSSYGAAGQNLGNKQSSAAKPKIKMVNQSVAKVARGRPIVMNTQSKPASKSMGTQPGEATGLQAPIRGSLHNRSATGTKPNGPPGLSVGQAQESSHRAASDDTARPSNQASQPKKTLVKPKKVGGSGRSITDVPFINGLIKQEAGIDDDNKKENEAGVTDPEAALANNWEKEELLLREMGWTDAMIGDDDEDDGVGLTEEEIKQFKLQVSAKEPKLASEIPNMAPPAWMTNSAQPIQSPAGGDSSSDESSDDELN